MADPFNRLTQPTMLFQPFPPNPNHNNTDAFLATLNAGGDFGGGTGMDDDEMMGELGTVDENAISLDTRDFQDAGACVVLF